MIEVLQFASVTEMLDIIAKKTKLLISKWQ